VNCLGIFQFTFKHFIRRLMNPLFFNSFEISYYHLKTYYLFYFLANFFLNLLLKPLQVNFLAYKENFVHLIAQLLMGSTNSLQKDEASEQRSEHSHFIVVCEDCGAFSEPLESACYKITFHFFNSESNVNLSFFS